LFDPGRLQITAPTRTGRPACSRLVRPTRLGPNGSSSRTNPILRYRPCAYSARLVSRRCGALAGSAGRLVSPWRVALTQGSECGPGRSRSRRSGCAFQTYPSFVSPTAGFRRPTAVRASRRGLLRTRARAQWCPPVSETSSAISTCEAVPPEVDRWAGVGGSMIVPARSLTPGKLYVHRGQVLQGPRVPRPMPRARPAAGDRRFSSVSKLSTDRARQRWSTAVPKAVQVQVLRVPHPRGHSWHARPRTGPRRRRFHDRRLKGGVRALRVSTSSVRRCARPRRSATTDHLGGTRRCRPGRGIRPLDGPGRCRRTCPRTPRARSSAKTPSSSCRLSRRRGSLSASANRHLDLRRPRSGPRSDEGTIHGVRGSPGVPPVGPHRGRGQRMISSLLFPAQRAGRRRATRRFS